jgi:hypothetical protein
MKKLLTALFFITLLSAVKAQDKYDYAIVRQGMGQKKVFVTINNKALDERKVETDCNSDCNSLLTIISEMSNQGWEVQTANLSGVYFFYFLRKKIN